MLCLGIKKVLIVVAHATFVQWRHAVIAEIGLQHAAAPAFDRVRGPGEVDIAECVLFPFEKRLQVIFGGDRFVLEFGHDIPTHFTYRGIGPVHDGTATGDMRATQFDFTSTHAPGPANQVTQSHGWPFAARKLHGKRRFLREALVAEGDGQDGKTLAGRLQATQQSAPGLEELPRATAPAFDEELDHASGCDKRSHLLRQLRVFAPDAALQVKGMQAQKQPAQERNTCEVRRRRNMRDTDTEIRPRKHQHRTQHEVEITAV